VTAAGALAAAGNGVGRSVSKLMEGVLYLVDHGGIGVVARRIRRTHGRKTFGAFEYPSRKVMLEHVLLCVLGTLEGLGALGVVPLTHVFHPNPCVGAVSSVVCFRDQVAGDPLRIGGQLVISHGNG